MAFKMKGSAFKLNNVATKSAFKQTTEPVAINEPIEESVVEEKVNPHGNPKTSHKAAIWNAINVGDPAENHERIQRGLQMGRYDFSPEARKNAVNIATALQKHLGIHGK